MGKIGADDPGIARAVEEHYTHAAARAMSEQRRWPTGRAMLAISKLLLLTAFAFFLMLVVAVVAVKVVWVAVSWIWGL